MATVTEALAHIDHQISYKRRKIAEQARGIAEGMEQLAASVERGNHVSVAPIQHAETVLNSYCGELSALIEARGDSRPEGEHRWVTSNRTPATRSP